MQHGRYQHSDHAASPAPCVAFIPPPAPHNDAELFFGSHHVTLGVRLGDIALSCSDPVRLPTSVVLALPKGAPVLITPPMVPDTTLIAMTATAHGAMKALGGAVRAGGQLFRQLRQVQKRSSGWGRISQALRNAIEHIRDTSTRLSCRR